MLLPPTPTLVRKVEDRRYVVSGVRLSNLGVWVPTSCTFQTLEQADDYAAQLDRNAMHDYTQNGPAKGGAAS